MLSFRWFVVNGLLHLEPRKLDSRTDQSCRKIWSEIYAGKFSGKVRSGVISMPPGQEGSRQQKYTPNLSI